MSISIEKQVTKFQNTITEINLKILEKNDQENKLKNCKLELNRQEADVQLKIAMGEMIAKNAEQRKAVIDIECDLKLKELRGIESALSNINSNMQVLENIKVSIQMELDVALKQMDLEIANVYQNTSLSKYISNYNNESS